jgi:predicted transcriptional regulator
MKRSKQGKHKPAVSRLRNMVVAASEITPPSEPLELSKFKWVEFARGCIRTTPPTMITLDQLDQYRERCGNRDAFISRFLYERNDLYTGPILSNFYIDLDSEKKPEEAQADAIKIVNYFVGTAGVPAQEPYLKIRWTGRKGFSVEVAYQLFGAAPYEHLDMVWRQIAEWFVRDFKLKTLDFSVYERTRLWRLTNSSRSDSSLYKIPLTSIELNVKLDEIRKKATQPQPYRYDPNEHLLQTEPIGGLARMYMEAKGLADAEVESRRKRLMEMERPTSWKPDSILHCVNEMIKCGAAEPGRETTAFQIACTLKWLGAPKSEAQQYLQQFMINCTPPLPPTDSRVQRALDSAYSRNDSFPACYLPKFKKLCRGEAADCPFHEEAEKDQEHGQLLVTPEEQAAAIQLLESPALLYEIGVATRDLVRREEANRRLLFLLNLAKQSLEITGESSSGKNNLVDAVLGCFPSETYQKVTGATEKALRYLRKDLRTLYLAERLPHRRDEESTTEMDIKLVISEGKLEILAVERNEEGVRVSETIKTSIENIIMTTTDVSIAPELENRIWSLSTDESREANREVVEAQLDSAATLPSQRLDCEPQRRTIRIAVRVLEREAPINVIIPYAKLLQARLDALFQNTRIRRDNKKLLQLIGYTTRLHYRQRPIVDDNGTPVLVALPEDLWMAWTVGETAILSTFTGLSRSLAATFEACKTAMKENKIINSGNMASAVNKRPNTVAKHLKELEQRGLLINTETEKTAGHPRYLYEVRPRDEVVFALPPEFYDSCKKTTELFLSDLSDKTSGIRPSETRDPLTGQVSGPQIQAFPSLKSIRHNGLDAYQGGEGSK